MVPRPISSPSLSEFNWCNPLFWQVRTVKAALHVSNTAADQLPLCREREVEQLQPAVWQAMLSSQGGFCYIAGTPGIGGTLIHEQIACTYEQPFTRVLDNPALRRLTHGTEPPLRLSR